MIGLNDFGFLKFTMDCCRNNAMPVDQDDSLGCESLQMLTSSLSIACYQQIIALLCVFARSSARKISFFGLALQYRMGRSVTKSISPLIPPMPLTLSSPPVALPMP
jgi:hypothetical protein